MNRILARLLSVAAAATAVVFGVAAPASAHTQVTLQPAQAGASNVVMTVNGQAESDTAGITTVQIVLPTGLAPDAVTWKEGPAGWTMARTNDGFTATGPALPVGTDARLSVTVAQLPTQPLVLVFKTLLTYSDGDIQRWIGGQGDDNPAPTVTLAAPAPGTVPSIAAPTPTASPTPTQASASPSAATPAARDRDDTPYWWLILAVLVLAGVGTAAYLAFGPRRRATPTTPSGPDTSTTPDG